MSSSTPHTLSPREALARHLDAAPGLASELLEHLDRQDARRAAEPEPASSCAEAIVEALAALERGPADPQTVADVLTTLEARLAELPERVREFLAERGYPAAPGAWGRLG